MRELTTPTSRAFPGSRQNRLNRERRSNGDPWKAELKVEKQIAQIVEAIADGMDHPSMKEKMTGLEARREELTALLADALVDTPDILPSASAIYAKKVVALTKTLNRREERQEASQDLRALIEKAELTPCPNAGTFTPRRTASCAPSSNEGSSKPLEKLPKRQTHRWSDGFV